jgi:hypothetical protein
MVVYVAAVLYAYQYALTAHRLPVRFRLLGLLPLALFSGFRGSSGKDTELYLLRWAHPTPEGDLPLLLSEPLFSALVAVGRTLSTASPVPFLTLHSLLVLLSYAFVCSHWSRARPYLLTVGPIFLIDAITNGMRIGLAYHLLMVGILGGRLALFAILATLTHLTTPVALAAWLLAGRLGPRIASVIVLTAAALSFVALASVLDLAALQTLGLGGRLEGKIVYYLGSPPLAWYSGLGDALVLLAILLLTVSGQGSRRLGGWAVQAGAAVFAFGAVVLGLQYSLGFFRIVKLCLVGILFSLGRGWGQAREGLLWVIGWLYMLNFLRQVSTEPGFLPYGGL